VAGTIYEDILYAVLSNFLLFSAIKVQKLISITTVPKPSLQSFFSVTLTSIKILLKHTNSLHFNSHVFRKQEGEQNILNLL